MQDIELKPCPFCGRQATIVMHPGNWNVKSPQQEGGMHKTWYVGCSYLFLRDLIINRCVKLNPLLVGMLI